MIVEIADEPSFFNADYRLAIQQADQRGDVQACAVAKTSAGQVCDNCRWPFDDACRRAESPSSQRTSARSHADRCAKLQSLVSPRIRRKAEFESTSDMFGCVRASCLRYLTAPFALGSFASRNSFAASTTSTIGWSCGSGHAWLAAQSGRDCEWPLNRRASPGSS